MPHVPRPVSYRIWSRLNRARRQRLFIRPLAPRRAVEHKTSSGTNVAIVIPLQRRRTEGAPVNPHSAEAYWRNSMVPVSIRDGRHNRGCRRDAADWRKDGMARPRLLKMGAGGGVGIGHRADQDRARQHVFLSPDAGRGAAGSASRAASANARNAHRTPDSSAKQPQRAIYPARARRRRPPQAVREPYRPVSAARGRGRCRRIFPSR